LYVSPSPALTSSAESFAFCNEAGLAAGASRVCTNSTGMTFEPEGPVAPGTYYVFGIVDSLNQVPESDETNNVLVMPGTITVN
jgi:hypothetical protein